MDQISYDDFRKLDIRIGTILRAEVPQWSHWVMKLVVDLGSEIGEKTCFSGIMKFFKPEDLEGKQYPFVVNMKPKKVGPDRELSEVMMIMSVPSPEASDGKAAPAEEVPPVLFNLSKKVENGTKVL
jgi:tRNA-binding EMAP/Myf-like protein